MFDEKSILSLSKEKKNTELLNYEDIVRQYKEDGYQIVTEQARYSAEKLVQEFSKKVDPEYQRRQVWDDKKKSKLIESLIINIPIPPIFLYEYDLYEYEVMDGQQRISTITSFLNNKFKLKDLQIWSELNNKYYKDLDEKIQRSIKRRYISAIILLKETAKNDLEEKALKQLIFERLNTGGTELNYQEIRNALYQGEFNRRLIEMSKNKTYRKLWGFNKNNSSRMEDVELILRFFSYISAVHLSISGATRSILDSYAEKSIQFSIEECDQLQVIFERTIENVFKLFGSAAFKSSRAGKSEKMIFDTTMLFAYFHKNNISRIMDNHPEVEDLKFEIIQNYKDEVFNGKYTSIKNVNERIKVFEKELL
ncbi:DUF262 domain-containing protein [Enterococcus casseliflavus]|uniref:DUF262 domain-containing protein n=1 Tax=Enterococcus casseliflavus TaxID=37734 RepID=UPI0018848729|nr:DUF262 domain-containing protein [Enterococcus casseliflavus]MBE9907437.1 DUF262 domain-containing protein [Enterococcus casseliflavus]